MKIVSNFLSNLFWQVSVTIFGFIIPPLVISSYGSSANGLISTFKQVINCLNVLEGGVGAAAIVLLYKAIATDDKKSKNEILTTVKITYIKVAMCFSLIIAVLSVSFFLFMKSSIEYAWLILIVMSSSTLIDYFFSAKYKVYLVAIGKNSTCSNVMAISTIINVVMYYLLIKSGFNLVLVQCSLIFCAFYRVITFFYIFKNRYSYVSWSEKNIVFIDQSRDVLAHQICGLIVFNTPLIIVSIVSGLEDASVFSIYFLVFNSISMLLNTLSNGVQAFFGVSLVTEKEKEQVSEKYVKFETLYLCVVFCVYSVTFLLINNFISIYTSHFTGGNYQRPSLAMLFLIVGVLDNIRVPGRTLISAAGHYKLTKSRTVVEAFINLSCSLLFGYCYGTNGVLFGAIISFIYRDVDIFFYVYKRILNINLINHAPRLVLIFLPFFVIVIGNLSLYVGFGLGAWLDWFFNAVAFTTFAFLIYTAIYFLNVKYMPRKGW